MKKQPKTVRTHATFFEHSAIEQTERWRKELGVVEDFNATLNRFTNLIACTDDPPDCEALDAEGRRVGIEVTELVNQKSAAPRSSRVLDWSAEQLTGDITRKLGRKGGGRIRGASYEWYVLIMHTDELMLAPAFIRSVLENHLFDRPPLINEAFVLLSYHPIHGYCVLPLRFKDESGA